MRLDKITIVVDDYDQAIWFFTSALGFDLAEDSPSLTNDGRPKRWVVVRPPGGGTGILLAEADGARQAVGFTSLGSFSSTFTRLAGEPPTVYRARDHSGRSSTPGTSASRYATTCSWAPRCAG